MGVNSSIEGNDNQRARLEECKKKKKKRFVCKRVRQL